VHLESVWGLDVVVSNSCGQGRQLHLGPLHAPQARQERKAAYEVTSNDVTKWQPMVKVSGLRLASAARAVNACMLLHATKDAA
jgi:hypothetical protein